MASSKSLAIPADAEDVDMVNIPVSRLKWKVTAPRETAAIDPRQAALAVHLAAEQRKAQEAARVSSP